MGTKEFEEPVEEVAVFEPRHALHCQDGIGELRGVGMRGNEGSFDGGDNLVVGHRGILTGAGAGVNWEWVRIGGRKKAVVSAFAFYNRSNAFAFLGSVQDSPLMKHPKVVIPLNGQTERMSCVAWATEVILLTFEKPLISLQKIPGFGFNEAEQQLAAVGIKSSNRSFGKDFTSFANEAHDALQKGVFPITVIPSGTAYNDATNQVQLMNHAYVVCENAGSLEFCSSLPNGGILIYPLDRFQREYSAWIHALKNSPAHHTDLLLHTLIPQQ